MARTQPNQTRTNNPPCHTPVSSSRFCTSTAGTLHSPLPRSAPRLTRRPQSAPHAAHEAAARAPQIPPRDAPRVPRARRGGVAARRRHRGGARAARAQAGRGERARAVSMRVVCVLTRRWVRDVGGRECARLLGQRGDARVGAGVARAGGRGVSMRGSECAAPPCPTYAEIAT